jgi:hypothetical protein
MRYDDERSNNDSESTREKLLKLSEENNSNSFEEIKNDLAKKIVVPDSEVIKAAKMAKKNYDFVFRNKELKDSLTKRIKIGKEVNNLILKSSNFSNTYHRAKLVKNVSPVVESINLSEIIPKLYVAAPYNKKISPEIRKAIHLKYNLPTSSLTNLKMTNKISDPNFAHIVSQIQKNLQIQKPFLPKKNVVEAVKKVNLPRISQVYSNAFANIGNLENEELRILLKEIYSDESEQETSNIPVNVISVEKVESSFFLPWVLGLSMGLYINSYGETELLKFFLEVLMEKAAEGVFAISKNTKKEK